MSDKPIILPASSTLEEAVDVFRSSGIIAFPTETFYGLCVNPFDPVAIEKLFELKGRPTGSPVSVIIHDRDMLGSVAAEVTGKAEALIKRFWPGPLTIVFKANIEVPPALLAHTGKIGVRVSPNPIARRLSSVLHSPITATSANPSGKKPPVTPSEVLDYFNGSIDILVDGGELHGKKGSTVVDATGPDILLIREGEIPREEILG